MNRILALLVGLVLIGAVLAIAGCESEDNAAARRAQAETDRVRAEAQAYQTRRQADTEAAAERAAIRQSEADAMTTRALAVLPYVLAVGGGVLIAGLMGLIFWDLRFRSPRPAVDPLLLEHLHQLQLVQQRQGRVLEVLARRDAPQISAPYSSAHPYALTPGVTVHHPDPDEGW